MVAPCFARRKERVNAGRVPHDRVVANVEEAAKHFNILVLKTNMTIPYTSVFIRLDCKYWSADAETRMRAKMAAVPPAH